jgi:hypothetical protein
VRSIGNFIPSIDVAKEDYSIRGRISALLRVKKYEVRVKPETLMKSKEAIQKEIKIGKIWENLMVFTPAEKDYFKATHNTEVSQWDNFYENPCTNPEKFWSEHDKAAKPLKEAIAKFRGVSAKRSTRLFPQGDKKTLVAWRKKSLNEKISEMSVKNYVELFSPREVIPGVQVIPISSITANSDKKTFISQITSIGETLSTLGDELSPRSNKIREFYTILWTKISDIYESVYGTDLVSDALEHKRDTKKELPKGKA